MQASSVRDENKVIGGGGVSYAVKKSVSLNAQTMIDYDFYGNTLHSVVSMNIMSDAEIQRQIPILQFHLCQSYWCLHTTTDAQQ